MSQTVGAVFELRDNFTAKARSIASATKSLESSVNGAAKGIKSFGSSGNIASRGVDSLKGKIVGLAGTYLSLQAVHKLADSAIGEASGLEQYRNTLNVVMKDSKKAKQTMSWAVDFANKTPFETDEVVEGAVKLQSYGIAAKANMTDIGNMSAVMNKSLDQGVEAIADAQTGELERLKEFGISKQMIIDQGAKIMKGKELVNNKGQIVDQRNFNKALFSLMQERYKGGMDLQSKTLKGTWSTVTGVAKNTLAQLMGVAQDGTIKAGGLFDKLKAKVNVVATTLQRWSNDGTITRATNKIEQGFNATGKAIGFVANHVGLVKAALISLSIVWGIQKGIILAHNAVLAVHNAQMLIASVRDKLETGYIIALYTAEAIHTGVTKAAAIAQIGLNAALSSNPIGIVIRLIGLAIIAGVALYKNWGIVKSNAIALWSSLSKTFENIKNSIIEKWNAVRDFLSHPIQGVINIAKNIAGGDSGAKAKVNGSHANGLARVPFDGYIGELHRDEMVLTKNQADNYRKGEGKAVNKTKATPIVNININGTNKSTKEIINEMIPQLRTALSNI